VKAFVVQRSIDLAAFDREFPLVLVAFIGGHQPAATLEEFLAHLSLKFSMSVGAARGCEGQ
jgi:hypothetical protein